VYALASGTLGPVAPGQKASATSNPPALYRKDPTDLDASQSTVLLGAPAIPKTKIILNLKRGTSGVRTIESPLGVLQRQSGIAVRLTNVRVVGSKVYGFRVFLNLPNATLQTPISHDRYVTSRAFSHSPRRSQKIQSVGSFVISIKPALAKAVNAIKGGVQEIPLTITLLPLGDPQARIGFESSELLMK
jgi:hypothetical protein